MKTTLAIFLALVPMMAADKPAATRAASKPAAAVLQIPAGAVEAQAGTFRYTDADGKKWIYRKTPFGVARMADQGQPTAAAAENRPAAAQKETVVATESDGAVHFERRGPFGIYKWDRKTSELTTEERAWLKNGANAAAAGTTSQQD
jgi:hypothetical protein